MPCPIFRWTMGYGVPIPHETEAAYEEKTGDSVNAMARRKQAQTVHDRRSTDLPINAVVATVVVDDPYERGSKVEVVASLRDDILRHLLARDEIDQAQFEAGRRYERYVEQSQIGSVKAMDPTKEPVDGGGLVIEPISDRQIAAVRELSEAARVLGMRGELLVRQILVERRKFKELAPSLAERDVAYVRRRFFDCLDELAVFWCLAGR